jgi:hypothetical protein
MKHFLSWPFRRPAFDIAALLCLVGCGNKLLGNPGVIAGSGQTIRLTKTADVQLVSEDVTIRPVLIYGFGRAEFECKFVLKNLSAKTLSIQVGFPLNSDIITNPDYHSQAELTTMEQDAGFLVKQFKFIARTRDCTYHVRFVLPNGDRKSAFFAWDMPFAPNETRVLEVSYETPFSIVAAMSHRDEFADSFATNGRLNPRAHHPRLWYYGLNAALVELFEYVTETGKSWAGKIERATFKIEIKDLDHFIRRRGSPWRELPSGELSANTDGPIIVKKPIITRTVSPDGWTERDGVISWDYNDYHPGQLIRICYWSSMLPQNTDDLKMFVKRWSKDPMTKEELLDFRQILLATAGIVPTKEAVRKYAENEIWYSAKPGSKESDLGAERKAMIAALDEIIRRTPAQPSRHP